MIVTWMLMAVFFTLCVGVAAMAAERLLRAHGRAARGAWITALAVSVTWPVLVPVLGPPVAPNDTVLARAVVAPVASSANFIVITPDNTSSVWSRAWVMTRSLGAQTRRVSAALLANASWLNPAALGVWAMLSSVLSLRLLIAAVQVQRLTRHATPAVVDGSPVLLAEGFGPASVGWRTPRVVVPQWVLALDTPLRALVLRHETEHCRSRDPRFVWCAAMATALMPWNAGLWWLARRLRLALELDCDMRTLQQGGDPRTYAKLLLFMTQQHTAPAAHLRLASSLAASRSHLATRIKAMQENSKLMSREGRLAALGVGALAVIGASATRIPDTLVAPDTPPTRAPLVLSAQSARDTIYFESQVEKPAAMRAVSSRMVYPELLRSAQVEGVVLASFVVNEDGVVDMSTFKVLKSDHDLFTSAVRTALPNLGYLPAEIKGVKVKQLVQQPFVFSLARINADTLASGRAGGGTRPTGLTTRNGAPAFTVIASAGTMEVDKPAVIRPGQFKMVYPAMLKSAQVEGTVIASFVVDELGVPAAAVCIQPSTIILPPRNLRRSIKVDPDRLQARPMFCET